MATQVQNMIAAGMPIIYPKILTQGLKFHSLQFSFQIGSIVVNIYDKLTSVKCLSSDQNYLPQN